MALNQVFQSLINPFKQTTQSQMFTDAQINQILDHISADNEKIWEREDSAYQRMVADMQKAGLNPALGISSGGLSTSPINSSMNRLESVLGILSNNREYMSKVLEGVNSSSQMIHRMSNDALDWLKFAVGFATGGVGAMFM